MNAYRGVHASVLFGQGDGVAAGGYVYTYRDDTADAGCGGSGDNVLAVGVELGQV